MLLTARTLPAPSRRNRNLHRNRLLARALAPASSESCLSGPPPREGHARYFCCTTHVVLLTDAVCVSVSGCRADTSPHALPPSPTPTLPHPRRPHHLPDPSQASLPSSHGSRRLGSNADGFLPQNTAHDAMAQPPPPPCAGQYQPVSTRG